MALNSLRSAFTPPRGIFTPLRRSKMAHFVAQSHQTTILLLLLALAVARFPPLCVCAAAAPTTNDLRKFRNDVDKKQNQISFLPREDYTSDTPTEREQNSGIQEKLQEASTEADATIRGGVKAANQGGEERVGEGSLRGKVRGNKVIRGVEGEGRGWGRVAPDMAAVVKLANDEDDSGGDSNTEDGNGGDGNNEDGNNEGLEEEGGGWGRVAPDMAAVVKLANDEDDSREDGNDEDDKNKGDNGEKDSSEKDYGEDKDGVKDSSEKDYGEDKDGVKDSGRLRPETEILTVCTPAGHAQVRISPARMGQTWRGWGTSLGWFANYIGKLPPHQLSFLLDLLFHPSIGLGLNLARYLIGGSFNPLLSPQFLTEACEAMAIPGYRVTASGPYDWSADWRQRRVLAGAIERGVEEVEAVAYSPPWWMTVSGDTAGLSTGKSNLKRGYYLAYAGYLADVVAHFREEWNVTFSTLNPANEALEGWWVRGNRQEGCNFNGTELNMLIANVVGTLKRRRLFDRTGVAGFDSFAGRTFRNWEEFSPLVKSALTRINVHGYLSPPGNGTSARDYIEGKFVG
ncbi:unnamed protein product [Closterium sp. Yama58-4]|nr:unnamed protein product [Closterium sp. Yama58-4]